MANENQTLQRPRHSKRVLEAFAVALPALFMVAGMVFLSNSLMFGAGSWLLISAVLVLSALVLTQHWIAYLLVLAAGIFFILQIGLLVLGSWIIGGIYLAVALPNLIALVGERRAARLHQ